MKNNKGLFLIFTMVFGVSLHGMEDGEPPIKKGRMEECGFDEGLVQSVYADALEADLNPGFLGGLDPDGLEAMQKKVAGVLHLLQMHPEKLPLYQEEYNTLANFLSKIAAFRKESVATIDGFLKAVEFLYQQNTKTIKSDDLNELKTIQQNLEMLTKGLAFLNKHPQIKAVYNNENAKLREFLPNFLSKYFKAIIFPYLLYNEKVKKMIFQLRL